jgi:hypothetical protein
METRTGYSGIQRHQHPLAKYSTQIILTSARRIAQELLGILDGTTRMQVRRDREMFLLVKIVAGNEISMHRDKSPKKQAECRALTVPPTNPKTNMKYNAVTGNELQRR